MSEEKSSGLIILGEMHGADINIDVIEHFVCVYKLKSIVFEWPLKWQFVINKLPASINQTIKIMSKLRDGRVQARHIDLLKSLKDKKINIFCMDTEKQSWNQRDKENAKKIKDILKNKKNLPCLVVTGGLHARKRGFTLNKQKMIPIGSYFKSNTMHVEIKYGEGKIENLGILSIYDKGIIQKAKTKDFTLIKSSGRYFGFDFIVKKTKPAVLIDSE